jgi:hypothetical protein
MMPGEANAWSASVGKRSQCLSREGQETAIPGTPRSVRAHFIVRLGGTPVGRRSSAGRLWLRRRLRLLGRDGRRLLSAVACRPPQPERMSALARPARRRRPRAAGPADVANSRESRSLKQRSGGRCHPPASQLCWLLRAPRNGEPPRMTPQTRAAYLFTSAVLTVKPHCLPGDNRRLIRTEAAAARLDWPPASDEADAPASASTGCYRVRRCPKDP